MAPLAMSQILTELSMQPSQIVFVATVALFTAAAAATDLKTRKLPNWLTVPGLLAGLVFHASTNGLGGLATSLGGFATGFGILLVLWLIGGGGGGDVKLMGALGAWLGARLTIYVFLLSTVFAVMASIALIVLRVWQEGYSRVRHRYMPRPSERKPVAKGKAASPGEANEQRARRRLLPYALPVALGTWLVLLWQVMVQRA